MHYVVYGRESNEVAAAIVAGLRNAGHKVTVQRAELFRPNEAVKNPDRVVVSGLRGKYTDVKMHYREVGIPIIVREAPHFRDTDRVVPGDGTAPRYQRLSLDSHAWIPPFDCPPDRFKALNLALATKPPAGRNLLICGQTDRDTQHGKTLREIAAWLSEAVPAIQRMTGLPPVWRPHPLAPAAPKPLASMPEQRPADMPLSEALANAGALLSYNSTLGLTALRMGIPVYCGGPATYRDAAVVVGGENSGPEISSEADVRALMARIAYTQWTMAELEAGVWVPTIERSLEAPPAARAAPEEQPAHASPELPTQHSLSLDQAIAKVADEHGEPFSIRDAAAELKALGIKAKRTEIRSELDILVDAGALCVTDPGGRGRARQWLKEAPA